MYSCEKDDSSIIDPILHFPSITSTYYTPQVFNSDTLGIIAGATVESIDPVEKVEVKFYDLGNNVLATINLQDNGVFPDTAAGDGKYTGILNYIFTCRQVGFHKIEFLATSNAGLTSNPIQNQFQVVRIPNQPPVISNLLVTPDSIQSGEGTFFIFEVKALDPNGECDIASVFYTGFAPDGSSLTRRDLFDDGSCCILPPFNATSGDTTAGDSKFTRKFFGSTTQLGYFRYFIKAVDNSGDTSNVLTDSIYVY